MGKVANIIAREVLDSRGNPTVEVEVYTSKGSCGRGIAPSGASVGSREALELRDKDRNRYSGKGVLEAVSNVQNFIFPAIRGINVEDQQKIDSLMIDADNTYNKSKLGANAILATSIACLDAAAKENNKMVCELLNPNSNTLPVPLMNIINGGAHANNSLDIQEFMIVPHGMKSFREAVRCGAEIFHNLKLILNEKNLSVAVGDEGGFAPQISATKEAIDLILLSIKKSGYILGKDVSLGLDVAASEFYKDRYYRFKSGAKKSSQELLEFYNDLLSDYPIISIEDGMAENDIIGWKVLSNNLTKVQLVGDDVFVTNIDILKEGVSNKIGNAILIKPNQIGTITETLDVINYAKSQGYKCVMSHRSGETEDVIISHLAVAMSCEQIKIGSLCRVDRTAKYNELMRIEDRLGKKSKYLGF